jgi:AAA15 family ATPase/GTPase
MKLVRFRVENFRSIKDSGWIDSDDVTTLVGVNEAGKSNLLLALWKLNPVSGGEINLLDDLPRNLYSELRDAKKKPKFIQCEFGLSAELIEQISTKFGYDSDDLKIVSISRDFDGTRYIGFPNYNKQTVISSKRIMDIVTESIEDLKELNEEGKSEHGIKKKTQEALNNIVVILEQNPELTEENMAEIQELIDLEYKDLKKSTIQPLIKNVTYELGEYKKVFNQKDPSSFAEIRSLIMSNLPSFVYYSNYGNLDSEIYLPHVIENLQRTDLSSNMEAKVRTLRVLFDFVKLDPTEILELGEEKIKLDHNRNPIPFTQEEIDEIAQKKEERDVLLQSASSKLTRDFKEWWKQGNYRFSFRADGAHFKIWVSDEKRPEEVSLEGRSTGLQWFLSFYLIFLVESKDAHKNAILLLDEAGVSLHPLAQKDLALFFESLSKTNQIVHTTHSPFLVDTNHIDRVKVVYADEEGYTVSSNNLREAEKTSNKNNSVYAVHAALGLTVSDVLLQGCKSIIVEGPSDQYYLNGIKNFLINGKLISPKEELVFIPAGGVRGIKGISSLVSGKDGELPVVLLDSDKSGKDFKRKLEVETYSDLKERIIEINDLIDIENAEVEDLIPFSLMEAHLSRLLRDIEEEEIGDIIIEDQAIIPQIEQFAKKHGSSLPKGWKVELARYVKQRLLTERGRKEVNEDLQLKWKTLFEKLSE